ncbi:hypothetical protein A6J66_002075 [Yersinia enterocolitica]|nr:hypothetical protein A6J66_002075 [Yersinia enterocolitica]
MMVSTGCYHIYGVCGTRDYSLFIDYVCESIPTHEMYLLQQIELCPDQILHDWQVSQNPQISEVFEIENVSSEEDAEEAVLFWRAYFSSLGETVIDGRHVGDTFSRP